MREVVPLIEQAQTLGASFDAEGDRVFVEAPSPLPRDLLQELRAHKAEVLAYLRERHVGETWPWVLQEWRRFSIPIWRQKLSDALARNYAGDETYARWMLREVLLDPDYQETPP